MPDSPQVRAFLADALPSAHTWVVRPTHDDLAKLPGSPGVFLFVDASGAPVQLLTTQQLKRVVISRLIESDEVRPGRADLAEVVRGIRWRPVHSPFEARWWYYRLIRMMHPRAYRKEVAFGPTWFLHVDWSRPIPELRISERIWCLDGEFLGPWPTNRSCQQALEGLWDLFELCRYPEQVRKAPAGARCAYADMGRCDAPCDGSAPLEQYTARCGEAWRFAQGDVTPWIQSAAARMKQAAQDQHYELAGQLKQQLVFAETWRQKWSPTLRHSQQFNLLLAVPATRRKAWKLFLFRLGHLSEGPLLSDRKLADQTPIWLDEQLRRPADEADPVIRMEQTWLVAHFLQHREARTAIVEALPDQRVPAGMGPRLQETLESRRKATVASTGRASDDGIAPGED